MRLLHAARSPEWLHPCPLQIHWFSIFNSFMMVIFLTGKLRAAPAPPACNTCSSKAHSKWLGH